MLTKPKYTLPLIPSSGSALDEAEKGRAILAEYIGEKLSLARRENDAMALVWWTKLADIVTENETGIPLGSLVFDIPYLIKENERRARKIPDWQDNAKKAVDDLIVNQGGWWNGVTQAVATQHEGKSFKDGAVTQKIERVKD